MSATRLIAQAELHRTARDMAITGALAGLAIHVAALLLPRLGALDAPLPLAALAGAVVYVAVPRDRGRLDAIAVTALAGALAWLALAAVRRGDLAEPIGAAAFAGLGLLFARGASGRRFAIAAAGGVAALLVARFVVGVLDASTLGPPWMVASVAGAGFGLVAMLGVLPRHLVSGLAGDRAELFARARAAGNVPRIQELTVQLADLDRRAAGAPSAAILIARANELDLRIAATKDEQARSEYELALIAVGAQVRDVASIHDGRERVLARLHRALEEVDREALAVVSSEADATSQAVLEADADPTA